MKDIVEIFCEYGFDIYIQKKYNKNFDLLVYEDDVCLYSKTLTKEEVKSIVNRMNEFLENS